MTSSNLSSDKRRRTYVRLIGEIRHALNQALQEEHERRDLTRTRIAEVLSTDKSFVTRKMNGTSNMTLETLADLAFALDRVVKVQLLSRAPPLGSNYVTSGEKLKPELSSSAGVKMLENASFQVTTSAT